MVCFMTLSRQVAGAECSGTWGAKRENTGGPRTVNPGAPKRPSPRARPLQATPPTSRSSGGTPTYFLGVGAPRAHFPGIPKVHGVFLHLEAAAGEVVVLDAVKIPTQAAHPLLGDKWGGA